MGHDFAPQGTFDRLLLIAMTMGALLASSGLRPRLLSTPQCTAHPPPQRMIWPQKSVVLRWRNPNLGQNEELWSKYQKRTEVSLCLQVDFSLLKWGLGGGYDLHAQILCCQISIDLRTAHIYWTQADDTPEAANSLFAKLVFSDMKNLRIFIELFSQHFGHFFGGKTCH